MTATVHWKKMNRRTYCSPGLEGIHANGNREKMMTIAARALDRYFSGTVTDKLSASRKLHTKHREAIVQHQDIKDGLTQLQQHVAGLDAHMGAMQMGKRCSACAKTPKGGCCSSYMAGNSDAILLLMNRLMGIDVSMQHSNDIDCCFLGEQGCILPVKPIFCLNYNCTHIQDAATPEEMHLLDRHTGAVLSLQTKIEGMLLELINRPIQEM